MKDEGVLNLVSIHKIRGQFKEGGNDIYMKILIGPNKITTKEISNAKKDFES